MRQTHKEAPTEDPTDTSDTDSTSSSSISLDIIAPTLVCDNESMINTSNKIITYPHFYPNSTMDSELLLLLFNTAPGLEQGG
jgi:hypothetical protein